MGLAKNRPPEQSPRLAYCAHQQIVNAVKTNIRLHSARDQKKYMFSGGALRDEGSPALKCEHSRFCGELSQCFRRKSLKKRNLDYLFNGGHVRIIDGPQRRSNRRCAQRIVWNAIYARH